MPTPYPAEFRPDVVAVARKHEAPLAQIAKTSAFPKQPCTTG
jgi:transposase